MWLLYLHYILCNIPFALFGNIALIIAHTKKEQKVYLPLFPLTEYKCYFITVGRIVSVLTGLPLASTMKR